jgi:DNA-binding FadR family transcriptional regulator
MRSLILVRNRAHAARDLDGAVEADTELHRAIGQASHNPVMVDLYENFLSAVQESIRLSVTATGKLDDEEHVTLVEAIAAGDPDAAAAEVDCFLDVALRSAEA